ncbi:MAG: hypothetical protein, partial [Olavius algarvensis Gamma 1 endosymbiont]
VARAQGERGTGMSRFASRARRHSEWGRKPRSDRRAISSTYSRRYISSHFQL